MDYKQLRSLSEAFSGVIYEKHKKGHDEEDEGTEDYEKPTNQEISHKGKSCKEVHPNEDHEEWEMSQNESVAEYFNNYFDGNLTEDTTNEDIMQAVYDLIDLTNAVMEAAPLSSPKLVARRLSRTGAVDTLRHDRDAKIRKGDAPTRVLDHDKNKARKDINRQRTGAAARAGSKLGMTDSSMGDAHDKGAMDVDRKKAGIK